MPLSHDSGLGRSAGASRSLEVGRTPDRQRPLTGLRHTRPVAVDPSPGSPILPRSVDQLTVTEARDDLLLVDPIDLGPGAPATAALELERGPQPASVPPLGNE